MTTRKRLTNEFKLEDGKLLKSSGPLESEIAQELDIRRNRFHLGRIPCGPHFNLTSVADMQTPFRRREFRISLKAVELINCSETI